MSSCVCWESDCSVCRRIEAEITRLHAEHARHHEAVEAHARHQAWGPSEPVDLQALLAECDAELGLLAETPEALRWIVAEEPDLDWLVGMTDRSFYLQRLEQLANAFPHVSRHIWEVLAAS